ncbi:MAG TPA: amidohydrolase [Bacteroidetes bacterium]|nr:amidohydrolase [Bacteroidota bacterium]
MNISYTDLVAESTTLQQMLVDVRRKLHQYPELGFSETQTASTIRSKLIEHGLTVSEPLAGTGFYTDIHGKIPGKLVAYRADIDALPIQDQKNVSYASKHPGIAHMCGHDYHTSVALGVALLLHQNRDNFKGTVRVFWQPAEETTPSGAPKMIEDGVLNNVDAVFGVHCDPHLSSGKVGIRNGTLTGSFDAFEIEVIAPNSIHSARPHLGKDAMWISNQLVQQMYQLSTRITDSRSPSVISVCTFHGGEAINVIPDRVKFSGTIRTSDPHSRAVLKNHVHSLCNSMESIHGVTITCEILGGAPPVINDASLFSFVDETLGKIMDRNAITYPEQSMGAEDFAYYGELKPAFFMRIGTSNGPETSYALHSTKFDVDESTLQSAVAIETFLLSQYLNIN